MGEYHGRGGPSRWAMAYLKFGPPRQKRILHSRPALPLSLGSSRHAHPTRQHLQPKTPSQACTTRAQPIPSLNSRSASGAAPLPPASAHRGRHIATGSPLLDAHANQTNAAVSFAPMRWLQSASAPVSGLAFHGLLQQRELY